jgi:hypothetical protein
MSPSRRKSVFLRTKENRAFGGDSTKGRARLQEISLQPFETRQLDIGAMQKQLGIPDEAHWALGHAHQSSIAG